MSTPPAIADQPAIDPPTLDQPTTTEPRPQDDTPQPESEPQPAIPITADLLLELELKQRERFGGERVSTGCGLLDGLFDGGVGGGGETGSMRGDEGDGGNKTRDDRNHGRGVERGIVLGVSAEGREGEGVLLSLSLLTSLLLSHLTTSDAAEPIIQILDTTGTFPLTTLLHVLKSRLSQTLTSTHKPPNPKEITTNLTKALETISITRVFDIKGIWEILSELPTTTQLLLIHPITPLLSSLLATAAKPDAHALITSLANTLHSLAHTQNVLVVLGNTTTAISTFYAANPAIQGANRSVFMSATVKPGLGQVFEQFVDLHVLVHGLPRGRADAEVLYGGEGVEDRDVKYAFVCEVLRDECPDLGGGGGGRGFGGREEMWVPVVVRADGGWFEGAFGEMGRADGGVEGGIDTGGIVEERVGLGVGNVAKVFGFGGRRV
ncbi:hypothetical protein GLAREA_02328 [Glarea lozoyensis ATCC 20868]|uniref:DNA recombination and repair protein Rad51-like C-terminal domain-containing protein n=1 Tax=Glarea lozoyensis (strain ATCC 20868 / MF5171) TaxID=1116229 RepID=S3CKY6_GLAL2|nr:uncharacterized protein GLAREA_02328 [Glarea lozoyensis ATCC 20868]EPE26415.1 hypothetical protein GLAREA_02328 [Glarea lozoyensis ATCC 20868]